MKWPDRVKSLDAKAISSKLFIVYVIYVNLSTAFDAKSWYMKVNVC